MTEAYVPDPERLKNILEVEEAARARLLDESMRPQHAENNVDAMVTIYGRAVRATVHELYHQYGHWLPEGIE